MGFAHLRLERGISPTSKVTGISPNLVMNYWLIEGKRYGNLQCRWMVPRDPHLWALLEAAASAAHHLVSKVLIDETGDGYERERWAMMSLVHLLPSLMMDAYVHQRQVECFHVHCHRRAEAPGSRRLELNPIF